MVNVIFPASHTVSTSIEMSWKTWWVSLQHICPKIFRGAVLAALHMSNWGIANIHWDTTERHILLLLVCATESMRRDSIGNNINRLKQCQRRLLQNPSKGWVNHFYLKYQWVMFNLSGMPNVFQFGPKNMVYRPVIFLLTASMLHAADANQEFNLR